MFLVHVVISCPAVPADLQSIADPRFIVVAWAAGLALAAGVISLSGIVGPGFTWLTAGVSGVVGVAGVLAEDGWWAWAGLILVVIGLLWARSHRVAGVVLCVAGAAFLTQAMVWSGWMPAVTAAIALGGVSGEMMLGHWYLIDPRLPRSALRGLAIAGMFGLAADGIVLTVAGLPGGGGTVAFWTLLVTSVVLMVAVVAALRYPAYSGVMAATGLSYLALLTTLGAVFLGRALVAGLGPFTQ
jgi:hypothetical protein